MARENQTDDDIVSEAKTRFRRCYQWESIARIRFDFDYKFANGDSHNMYQWDDKISQQRVNDKRPCLTINKTETHNDNIINDSKQNKPGVNVRPVGDDASFEAAQIFQEVVRHIEYISNAESAYDHATDFQVIAGIGYWRVTTDYINDKSFDQEIYIKPIRDPRSVYLDPDIDEDDGSDARFGFVFDDMPKDLYKEKYPDFADIGWSTTFDLRADGWLSQDTVRVAEYYRKIERKEKLVMFVDPESGEQVVKYISELSPLGKQVFQQIKNNEKQIRWQERSYNERSVITNDIEWFKIAGNAIIDTGPWLGKYIPIVRVVGKETIIDGILDRKGHTRRLIDAQKMYNYNSSSNTEFGALQTKSPWIAPAEAIEGHEEMWNTANVNNYSVLTYNHVGEDGKDIPPPSRPQPPQPGPAYVQGLQIAQNEMMMASGQYQAQFGENENAKSGVAINARQRQGDRATYHFIDNQAKAIRFTGKILIDLIPKVYDTKRVIRIQATDGGVKNITVDVNAEKPFEKLPPKDGMPQKDTSAEMVEIIFNPAVGQYDVVSEVGPSYATKRQEAFNALTQIAAQNKEFMGIAGDILWKVADFPEAQVLAERWRKVIPKNITGDALDPAIEQAMHEASAKIEQMLATIAKMTQDLADKDKAADVNAYKAETERKTASANAHRLDYEAETDRLLKLGNSENLGPEIKPIIDQLVQGMIIAGEPPSGGLGEVEPVEQSDPALANGKAPEGEQPPVPGARKAPDGNFYVDDGQGGYLKVEPKQGAPDAGQPPLPGPVNI